MDPRSPDEVEMDNSSAAQAPDSASVTAVRICTVPFGAQVTVGGHDLGRTTPSGLRVPCNRGPIVIRKFLYKPRVLTFDHPPESAEVPVVELTPVLPLGLKTIVLAFVALFAVSAGLVVLRHPEIVGPSSDKILLQTEPGCVEVFESHGHEIKRLCVTDHAGRFWIPRRPSGTSTLEFRKDYFKPVSREVDWRNPELSVVTLERSECDLLGKTDPGGVEVIIDGEIRGKSEDNGELEIKRVPVAKALEIVFSLEGRPPVVRRVTPERAPTFQIGTVVIPPPTLRTVLKVSADPPRSQILIGQNGVFSVVGQVTESGKAEITTGIPLGVRFMVKVEKKGWKPSKPYGPYTFNSAELTKWLNVKLAPELASLRLKTDPPGAKIRLDGKDVGETDAEGTKTLEGIQVCVEHTLEVTEKKYEKTTISLNIPVEAASNIWGYPDIIRLKPQKSSQEDFILTLHTDPPRVDVKAIVGDKTIRKTSDESGILKLPLQGPGKATLHFEKKFFEPKTVPFEVNSDTVAQPLQVRLRPKQSELSIKTLPGALVTVNDHAGNLIHEATTNAEGVLPVTLEHRLGPFTIAVQKEGFEPKGESFSVDDIVRRPRVEMPLNPLALQVALDVSEPEAEILLVGRSGPTSLGNADQQGKFTRSISTTDFLALEIRKKGFRTEKIEREQVISRLATGPPFKVQLERAVATLVLKTNVPGVRVIFHDGRSFTTDSDRKADIPGIPVGVPIRIEFRKPSFVWHSETIEVPVDYAETIYFHAVKPMVKEPTQVKFSIRVGEPDVQICRDEECKQRLDVTNPDGVATFDIDPGNVPLWFIKDYFEHRKQVFHITTHDAGTMQQMKQPLKRTHADLILKTDPGDVKVSMDGKYIDTSDRRGILRIPKVEVGKRVNIVGERIGWTTARLTILVPEKAHYEHPEPMVLKQSKLTVKTQPGANVRLEYQDGPKTESAGGNGECRVFDLPLYQPITIKVSCDGFYPETYPERVQLTEDKPEKVVEVKLKEKETKKPPPGRRNVGGQGVGSKGNGQGNTTEEPWTTSLPGATQQRHVPKIFGTD